MASLIPRGGASLEPGEADQRQHSLQDSRKADEHDEQLEKLRQSAVIGKFVDRPKTDGTEDDNNQNTDQRGNHPSPLRHRLRPPSPYRVPPTRESLPRGRSAIKVPGRPRAGPSTS